MAKQTIGIGSAANDGTGDTLRSAFDKVNDNFTELYDASSNSSTLNVLTYGADNTGATDSLAAFDAAIAAASAGDRIYIPTGTFSLSNTWTISKQVTIFGPGTITEASVLTPVIEVTADKVQLHDFTVSGIETTGNWNTSAATIHARCGIHINDGDDCLISRVRIVTKSTGIKLTAANRTTIRDALWQGINLASQPASYAESAGLRTVSAIDVLVDGGSWTLGGRGMALEGVLTARVTIKSPTIYTCESDGIYIDDPSGVQILGGWIQGVDGYGINIEDGDTLTVSNVYVRSNTSASMFLGAGTVSSLKLNQSDLASLTFSTGTYDDVDLSGSDIATLTTTSGGTLKGVKGTPKSLSTVTHGATAGKLAEELSVLTFGATGDGTTDDTAAIQAAIDAAETLGVGVYFPAGTYRITADLELYTGCRIKGAGIDQTTIVQATSGQHGIANASGTRLFRVHISDLLLTTASGVNAGNAIHFEHVSDSIVENIRINRDGGAGSGYNKGIFIGSTSAVGGAFRNIIRDVKIVTSDTAADRYGIHLNSADAGYGGNSTRITDSELRGSTSIAVYIDEGDQVFLSGCVCEGDSATGVYIDGNEATIVGCRFENTVGSNTGIVLDAAYATIVGNLFSPSLTTFVNNTGSANFTQNIRELRATATEPDGDTTPDVTGQRFLAVNDTSPNTISDFDGAIYRGQILAVFNRSANTTFAHNSNIKLLGETNYKPPIRSLTEFYCDGAIWYEIGRRNLKDVSVIGDANATLTGGTSNKFQWYNTALTTNRTITLTGVNDGDEFFIKADGIGGTYTVDVGGLKTLADDQWAHVVYTGASWQLFGFGSL